MRKDKYEDQIAVLKQVYGDMHHEHGAGPKGVGWQSPISQQVRFGAIVRGLDFTPHSILDVGCGYGHLAPLLDGTWLSHIHYNYTGIDIVQEYIDYANEHFGRLGQFFCQDSHTYADLMGENSYDLVVGSGVTGMWQDPYHLLTDMWFMARKCMAFNWCTEVSSLTVDRALAFAHSVGCKNWLINHNYLTNDYTMHMYKHELLTVDNQFEEVGEVEELVSV